MLGEDGILGFLGTSTLPMQSVLNTTGTTAVQIWCETQFDKATSGSITAAKSQIYAIQTSSNS